MRRLGNLSMGKLTVLCTLVAVVIVLFASGQQMFSAGPLNAENRSNTKLGGVASHAEIKNCSACHVAPWSRDAMASRCMDCHSEVREQLDAHGPMHGLLTDGMQCRACHTEHKGPHGVLTDMTRFDHNCAAFKLTGRHEAVDCKTCHVEASYKGTPQECSACHVEPKVHKGQFGFDCAQCHTTNTWDGATFNRNGTKFDHDLTAFKLTGKHKTVDCKSCHKTDTFKGTPQTCVSCHAEPPVPKVHKMTYGSDCAKCHTTTSFTGATFKHTFPINHHNGKGGKGANTCATCHQDTVHFVSYTCYNCHAHEKTKMERKHANKLRGEKLDLCTKCHGAGRKKGRSSERADASGIEWQGCPEAGDSFLGGERTLADLLRIKPVERVPEVLPVRREGPLPSLFDPMLIRRTPLASLAIDTYDTRGHSAHGSLFDFGRADDEPNHLPPGSLPSGLFVRLR